MREIPKYESPTGEREAFDPWGREYLWVAKTRTPRVSRSIEQEVTHHEMIVLAIEPEFEAPEPDRQLNHLAASIESTPGTLIFVLERTELSILFRK